MDRPAPARARALARKHRPALLLSAAALVIAAAGTLTGASLAGGHDEHGGTEHGHQVELRIVPPNHG